jgi:hypothetical protein
VQLREKIRCTNDGKLLAYGSGVNRRVAFSSACVAFEQSDGQGA